MELPRFIEEKIDFINEMIMAYTSEFIVKFEKLENKIISEFDMSLYKSQLKHLISYNDKIFFKNKDAFKKIVKEEKVE